MQRYIYQHRHWPHFTWRHEAILNLLAEARHLQGRLLGRMEALGFDLRNEAQLDTLTLEVLKTSEIEGEVLNSEQVRSSIARKLGIEWAGSVESDRTVDGVVEMMLDATQQCFEPLTPDRLFGWHAALFPFGRSGLYKIQTGEWRTDSAGPMQVVSGPMGKESVHFQAPDAALLESEIHSFLNWFNHERELDLVLKAGIAHLWFVTLHPFEDGNGRITRALTEMLLAQSDKSSERFYSMSAQIRVERKAYYEILEVTQKGDLDITAWLEWFLNCLIRALQSTDAVLVRTIFKSSFWTLHAHQRLNERQKKLLNKMLDGLEGNMTSSKWAKMGKCSKDTAIRDIQDLIEKDILYKAPSGGRSTHYELVGGIV
jgi:Fic family protein